MTTRSMMLASAFACFAIAAHACSKSPTAADNTCEALPTAPRSARVDLGTPAFSNPTNVNNPLFPIGALDRVVLLGSVGGVPLRVETTLMAARRTIVVNGRPVESLTSQYVAWVGRELHEVAMDCR